MICNLKLHVTRICYSYTIKSTTYVICYAYNTYIYAHTHSLSLSIPLSLSHSLTLSVSPSFHLPFLSPPYSSPSLPVLSLSFSGPLSTRNSCSERRQGVFATAVRERFNNKSTNNNDNTNTNIDNTLTNTSNNEDICEVDLHPCIYVYHIYIYIHIRIYIYIYIHTHMFLQRVVARTLS